MLPPEHPHVAFQSPLLEYSSALGLAGGGSVLSSKGYPAALIFPQSMDTPRYLDLFRLIPLPNVMHNKYNTNNRAMSGVKCIFIVLFLFSFIS